jgi:hypothetical protein
MVVVKRVDVRIYVDVWMVVELGVNGDLVTRR